MNLAPDTDALEAELERAWSVLSAAADSSRRVVRPIHILRQSSLDYKHATNLIQTMEQRGWLRVDTSLMGLRAVYLLRNTEVVLVVTVPAVIKETAPSQKTEVAPKAPPRQPTAREIDGTLYEEVLRELLERSFRHAWDGYVPLSTCLRKLHGVDFDAEDTLKTLIAKGYCSVHAIRGTSLEDASFPCSPQDGARMVVSIDDIPVAPPPNNQFAEKTTNGSASYRDPLEAVGPLDWASIKTSTLPPWHPLSEWDSGTEEPLQPPKAPPSRPISPPKPEPVRVPESLGARVAREDGELEDACYQMLRTAMRVDRDGLVYAYMSVLAPVFNARDVSNVGQRRAIVARLIERKLIEPRGKSSIIVLGVAKSESPTPKVNVEAPPETGKIDLAYRTLVQQKSKRRTDDGHSFTTHPFDVLSRWPPYIKDREEARSLLAELEQRGWIRHIQTGATSYVVLLR